MDIDEQYERELRDIEEKYRKKSARLEWEQRLMLTAILVVAFSIVGGGFYLILRKSPNSPATAVPRMKGEPLGLDEGSAQVLCEEAIKSAAKDPEQVKVPFVLNQGKGSVYEFNWLPQTSLVRMRNGLGVDVAIRASCVVSTNTGAIISLTLDGEKLR